MPKHIPTKPGTQRAATPLRGAAAQRQLSPGPPFPGFRPERPVEQNPLNTDRHGTATPWADGKGTR